MRDKLIYLALVVLDEAVEEARKRPVKPSVGLRLALAYLYSVSDLKRRRSYDGFWKTATGLDESPTAQPDYVRGTYACGYLQAICRSVGIEYTVAIAAKLRDGHRRSSEPQAPVPP